MTEFQLPMRNLANGGLIDHEYSFKCQNCRYGRQYGNAELTVRVKAASHALRKQHCVDIYDYGVLTWTVDHTRDDKLGDAPPF